MDIVPQSSTRRKGSLTPTLSILIVNYNSGDDVDRLLTALGQAPEVHDGRCEVIVVENASTSPSRLAAESSLVGTRLIRRADNGGFAVGVNAGWRESRGRWLLLLNPDMVVGSDLPGRVLDRIVHHEAREDGPPGIIGFALRDPDGSRQPSVGLDPSLFRSLGGLFLPRRRRKYQTGSRVVEGPVAWVTGACALVDAQLMKRLGGLDEDFFLYYEEVALCQSARSLGRRVEYDPGVEVVHLHPLQNRSLTPALRVITRHSKLLYFLKHLPRWQFTTLAWIVAIEGRLRLVLARGRNQREVAGAWRVVLDVARRMREGEIVRGQEVRDRAFSLNADARIATTVPALVKGTAATTTTCEMRPGPRNRSRPSTPGATTIRG